METATAIEARRKKVIIDYAALHMMFERQGIEGGVNVKILSQVLTNHVVPEARLQGNLVAVVTPGIKRKIGPLLRKAGFTVVEAPPLPGADDDCVKAEIARIESAHTTDIVLVGVDTDYFDCLLSKQSEGVTITLAAIDASEDGYDVISGNMRRQFSIFDLSPHKERLAVILPEEVEERRRRRNKRSRRGPENVVIVVTIQDELAQRKRYVELLQEFLDQHGFIGRID